ncbi:hypothetical protein JTB14_002868 [Gonioctena quinquepunctata]|nr:hypothetical protein JTB14_002868 [Gonioctena quinquepunctata]
MFFGSNKIICQDYPSEFILDKTVAKEYFRQFGKLKRLVFKPKLRLCSVEYADEKSYQNALYNAGEYKGVNFKVSAEKSPEVKKKKVVARTDPIWLDKNEIQDELAAMAGNASKRYNTADGILRSGVDSINSLQESSKPDKSLKLKRVWKSEVPTHKKKIREHFSASISKEKMELVNLVLSQAFSVEDKYKILDARDKLIRAKLKKSGHVNHSATVGTCPDMCPEKERMMRETQHQVALYEQEQNGKCMDQRKAVKQYSRSSADQESPLPHELRPVSILQMTMCYLMNNIMDLCDSNDVNIAEWFHFLWDRTRGIRKDITQQELCCQGAVELVEQCARFHIHCSARLVSEDPSVFDQKINTENLTKCLQTLKYMYHDLQLKGETCPNEAEFRAYVILLNLNDGNFMWEVQELPQHIQKSNEVQFALKVYSALDKNNYVGFFKLVYSTTYLNACLLMRYFVQVRITAIKTLLKCYLPRASKTTYPLSELKHLLAFDDIETTTDFMETCGISINEEKTHVILEKNTFVLPEFPYVLDRSLIVVESKKTNSVGRMVCGRDIPSNSFENHMPQNSFDQKGYLSCKDIVEESELEQTKLKLLVELDESLKSEETDSSSQNIMFGKEDIDSNTLSHIEVAKALPFSSVFKQDTSLSKDNVSIFGKHLETSKEVHNIFGPAQLQKPHLSQDQTDFGLPVKTNTNLPKAYDTNIWQQRPSTSNFSQSKSLFAPETQVQAVKPGTKKGGFPFNLLPASDQKVTNVFSSPSPMPVHQFFAHDKSKNITQSTTLHSLPDKKPEGIEEISPVNKNENVEDSNNALSKINEEIIENKRKLEELKRQEELEILKKNEEEKLKELKRKKQQEELKKRMVKLQKEEEMAKELEIINTVKNVMESIITKVESDICNEKIEALNGRIKNRILKKILKSWHTTVLSNKRKRKAIDCSPVWVNTKTLKQSAEELHTSSQDLTLQFMKRYKFGKPFDIEVCIDDSISRLNIFQLTYSTLNQRFYDLTGISQKNIFWKLLVSLPDDRELPNGLRRIEENLTRLFDWKDQNGRTLLVEKVKCNATESMTYCIEKQKGTNVKEYDANGIIFIAKDFNPNLQRRIFENLKGFGVFTKVPIVILLQDYNKNEKCNLDTLIEEKILTDFVILSENLTPHGLTTLVEQGLVFLASKVEKQPPLELDTLNSFIQKYLCSEIWKRANSFSKWNSHYKSCLQSPNIVLGLYNEALARLKKIILNKSCKEYAEFPEVFQEYLNSEIPDFLPCHYQYFPKFWREQTYSDKLENILKGLSLPKWQQQWPCSNESELEVNVSKYCARVFKKPEKPFYKIMSILLRNVDPNLNFEDITKVLWTDVVELLGLEKLGEIDLSLNNTEFENRSVYNQFFVVYDTKTLENYNLSDWFYINNPTINRIVKEQLCKERDKIPSDRVNTVVSHEEIENVISRGEKQLANRKSDSSEILKGLAEFNALLQDLETSIVIHRKISSKIEENLKKAIEDK